jgi:putative SOS response-associated peptidase YedK
MCGRFAQKLPSHLLLDLFKTAPFRANVKPSYNVAPTDMVMVVRAGHEKAMREIELMKWGLVPPWSNTGKMEFPTINAKSETAATSAVFRNAFKARRCVVPADAFYEWQKLGTGPKAPKQPYAVARADGQPLCLAGLWDGWKNPDGQWQHSFTIMTTAANEAMAPIHDRMPVILDMKDVPLWLGEVEGDHAGLLKPYPASWLKMWKVSAAVGSVKNNDESLLEPV